MKKMVAIIALDPRASQFYADQVQKLFGDYIETHSYSVQEGTVANMVRSDLYVMSTDAFDNREDVPQYIPIDAQISEIHVGYQWKTIRQLQEIPSGTKALFVNMTEKMVREATTTLNQLGVNHIDFIPFYPGAEQKNDIELAITPDEERYVPDSVKRVINIGHRSCTSGTMIEIALKLGLEELLETEHFQEYMEGMASSNYSFDTMFTRSRRLESQFDILMDILDEGIIGVNEKGEIFAVNEKAEEITGLKRNLILHKQAGNVLSYLPLVQCLKTKEKMEPRVVRIHGTNVGTSVVPVLRQEECIGAFAILQRFNDAENRQHELRNQLMHKGYRAKYTFEDVIGESEGIGRTKSILRRMAGTGSPVLLIGETGTGKELFAHAVHQASGRSDGPFVAINCAAMPENLLESELFGYEEGAFTGARKGGRLGQFEFAHRGTLFLDEVEGMSPALQVKLLRVLQEHEIMRVGGNKIISVDVRIVAATNESLEEKVEDGSFRRDLYYRLNTLPVLIPPLRERGDDVFLLMDRFMKETGGAFVLSEEVKQTFREYDWPGNIRELRNLAEYFSFTGSPVITRSDLPPTFHYKGIRGNGLASGDAARSGTAALLPGKNLDDGVRRPLDGGVSRQQNDKVSRPLDDDAAWQQDEGWSRPVMAGASEAGAVSAWEPWELALHEAGAEEEEWLLVLGVLYENGQNRKPTGRDAVLESAHRQNIYLSQIKARTILRILKEQGLVKGGRGRGGCHITLMGKEAWIRKNKIAGV